MSESRAISMVTGQAKSMPHSLFRTKSTDALIAACEDPDKKTAAHAGPLEPHRVGIGAVIAPAFSRSPERPRR